MDNEQVTGWLKAVAIQVNRALRLMPAIAWERDINVLLAQYGGDKVLQMASTLGIIDAERFKLMIEQYPDLGNQLANGDAQQALRNWVSTSSFAAVLKTLRLMTAWVISPDEKTSSSQLEWQIEDVLNNSKIYRTILRGGPDEEDIRSNQGEC